MFEEVPQWVKPIDIPQESSVSKYDVTAGYYLKLSDYQVNLSNDAYFFHEVRNIISRSGITKASQLLISYDSSYQSLKIHHLYIWRNGKKEDRTKDLNFKTLNNEYNLQQGIYSGKITVYNILNDIRQNDLIDFSYTLVGSNPIFNHEKYLFIPLESISPIDLFSVIILYPKEKKYNYKCVDCDNLNVKDTILDNFRQIEIYDTNLSAFKLENNMPTWLIPYKYFTLSSLNSWEKVNEWAQDIFSLKKEPDLQIVFEEIFTGNETTEEKIDKIINFVQDEIRYMGIETGIGSIQPFPPEQVVKQRFGDCKDKSLLLVSLLRKINIKAYPALVNVAMKHKTAELLPSNQVFNHSIVTFTYNDTVYWVDPSISQQGGHFKELYTPNYGKALVVGKSSDSLYSMPWGKNMGYTSIKEELSVESFFKPADYKLTSIYYGFDADKRRSSFEYYTVDNLSEAISKDLKQLFPVVNETEKIKIEDDIVTNKFITSYHYSVDGFWQDKETNSQIKDYRFFKYEPIFLYQYLGKSTCEERKYDLSLDYPMNLEYQTICHFPDNILIYDTYDKTENEAFSFEKKIKQLDKHTLQFNYSLKFKSNYIKAVDYKKICEIKNEIVKKSSIIIYFPE